MNERENMYKETKQIEKKCSLENVEISFYPFAIA